MFLRKNRRRIDGETNEGWTLCESVRTERGPRQRVVATLGNLDDDNLRAGWTRSRRFRMAASPADRVNNDRLYRALGRVGTPKSQLRTYETDLAEKENWVEARLVAHLGLRLPRASRLVENVVEKTGR